MLWFVNGSGRIDNFQIPRNWLQDIIIFIKNLRGVILFHKTYWAFEGLRFEKVFSEGQQTRR